MSSVVITVNHAGELRINREPIEMAELEERLRTIFRNQAKPVVFVQGHPDLEFRQVATAIDTAKGAGVAHVGLMTQTI